MKRLTTIPILLVLILSFTALAGCTKVEHVFVCADGKQMEDPAQCATNKLAGVSKVEAESYARNFVNAYFIPYSGKVQFVSSFLDATEGDYKATFIVSEKGGSPMQTKVLIDGVTGEVSCLETCDYVNN